MREDHIDVSLLQFSDFVRAPGPQRLGVVTGQVGQRTEPYTPVRDFYRRFVVAARAGRVGNDDRAAVQRVVQEAPRSKAGTYAALAEGWLAWVPEIEHTTVLPNRTARWRSSRVTVRITPHLTVAHPDGRVEAIRLYTKQPKLEPGRAEVALWLMRQVAEQLHPAGAAPVLVDVRRGEASRPEPQDDGFAAWLHTEAHAYRTMLTMVA